MQRALLVVPLLLASLAGCLGGDVDSEDPVVPIMPGVELESVPLAWEAGNISANLRLRGDHAVGGMQEVDAWGDYLFAVRGTTSIVILHVTHDGDDTILEPVNDFALVPAPKDVKVSDDGKYLFVGNDEQASIAPIGGLLRDGGLYTINIEDMQQPELVHYLPIGPTRGPHMVAYHRMPDGQELVFGANGDISINRFDRETESLTELARYMPPTTEVNRNPFVLDAYYQVYAHDMFVMDDPVTNQTLMYVSNWDAGLRIVDVSDPSNPVELGAWNDFPPFHAGNIHTAATTWIGDRRITVASPEVGFAVVGGIPYALDMEWAGVYILDTTDAADIKLLGMWENPDQKTAGRQDIGEDLYSPHNIQLEHGRLFLAHYMLGAWVIDLSTPELQAAPQAIAYYVEPGMNTWDVVLNQGVLYSSGAAGIKAYSMPDMIVGPGGVTSRA